MAAVIRSEHDLPTVRVRLGRERDVVELDVMRGRHDVTHRAVCPSDAIGTVRGAGDGWRSDQEFSLPQQVLDTLRLGLDAIGPSEISPHNAAWLEVASPRGYLPLLPWERMLAPIGRPVLRLPNHTVRPQSPSSALEVALCAGSPVGPAGFDAALWLHRLARQWLTQAGHAVRLHLFAGVEAHARLASFVADLGSMVVVHDPAGWRDHERRGEEPAPGTMQVTSPWLLWIAASMAGTALDVAHFVTHGYMTGERGAMALAGTPHRSDEGQWSRFVGAAEMSAFLAQAGAWSLMLTGPPGNVCGTGLRDLADVIAWNRPGVTATHELDEDPAASQLGRLLHLVYADAHADLEPMPAAACWVHPRFVEYPLEEQDSLLVTPEGRSALVQPALRQALHAEETPAWLASGTRYLEQLQAMWLAPTAEGRVDAEAVAALESVSDLLEQHAQRHLGDQGVVP